MLRTHNCNSLNSSHINEKVTLTGWVQKTRDLGVLEEFFLGRWLADHAKGSAKEGNRHQ